LTPGTGSDTVWPMTTDPTAGAAPSVWCPRCGGSVAPDLDVSGVWWCPVHGQVPGLHGFAEPSVNVLLEQAIRGGAPTWVPWPLPALWSVSGAGHVGDDRAVATVLACSGPDPLGALGDVLLIAEDPGTGLGAGYAGLPGPDPDTDVTGRPADAKLIANGHPSPLWHVSAPDDREVYVGEAAGRWLWVIGWPGLATAAVLLGATTIVALSDIVGELDVVPLTGLSGRLARR